MMSACSGDIEGRFLFDGGVRFAIDERCLYVLGDVGDGAGGGTIVQLSEHF